MSSEPCVPARPAKGYLLRSAAGRDRSRGDHFIGGRIPSSTQCPNCRKRLTQLVQLDVTDSRIEVEELRVERLSLAFCWTCELAMGEFFYRLVENGLEILRFQPGPSYSDFPYALYPPDFPPVPVELDPIPDFEQELVRRRNRGVGDRHALRRKFPEALRPRHQVGGEPLYLQPWRGICCVDCRAQMPFFASIGNWNGSREGFAGTDFVQVLFHLCRACRVVGCCQMTD